MTAEDLPPRYTTIEEDSPDVFFAEKVDDFNWHSGTGLSITALIPVQWSGVDGKLMALRNDGSIAVDTDGTFEPPEPFNRSAPRTLIATATGMVMLHPDHPDNQTIKSGFRALNIPVPDVVQALNAREAALVGDAAAIRTFTCETLKRWSGWSESFSTALLGNWADPLFDDGQLTPGALDLLRVEASMVQRQLTPIWNRKSNGSRLLLLDTPLGDGLTLYDLVPGRLDAESDVEDFDDPRLSEILEALSPDERAVVLAMSLRGVSSWAEAALAAGFAQPAALAERVRRKVKRLAARITGGFPQAGRTERHGR